MAYNTKTTTTATGQKIYYKGPYGEWDDNPDIPEEKEEEITTEKKTTTKKNKVLIWGALIAAALFLFK